MNESLAKGGILHGIVFIASVLFCPHSDCGESRSSDFVRATIKSYDLDLQGNIRFEVALKIKKDWYMYANPVGNKNLNSLSTTLQIISKSKSKFNIEYPSGSKKIEGDSSYYIYQQDESIFVTGRVTSNELLKIEVVLRFYLCNERTTVCLPESTVRLQIPIQRR